MLKNRVRLAARIAEPQICFERADDDVIKYSQPAEGFDDLKGSGYTKLSELVGPQAVDAVPAE